jgi:acyl dehydratase
MTSASLAEVCVDYFGPAFFEGGRIRCKFIHPVYAGDVITARGTVRAVTAAGDRPRVTLDLWAENQDGRKVVAANAESWWA